MTFVREFNKMLYIKLCFCFDHVLYVFYTSQAVMSLMMQMKTKSEIKCLTVVESAVMAQNLKSKCNTGFKVYSKC